MKKEEKDQMEHIEAADDKHSLVCNDQLFFQELRIAAEDAEKDYEDQKPATS